MFPDLSKELFSISNKKPRILIIDDSKEFCELMENYVDLLNCLPVSVTTVNAAKDQLEISRKENNPFTLAMIDLQFRIGKGDESNVVNRGTEILRYIKVEHPNVACLMISGVPILPSHLLDFRDYYDLDYYLSKDKLEPAKVAAAMSRAIERVKIVQKENASFNSTSKHLSPRELREFLDLYFNVEELKDLCFNIDIEYELLEGNNKSGKSRELINYARRHGRYYDLINQCYALRPHPFNK